MFNTFIIYQLLSVDKLLIKFISASISTMFFGLNAASNALLPNSYSITPITPKNIDATQTQGYYNPIKTTQRAGGWIAGMQ